MDKDEYEELINELVSQFDLDYSLAEDIVSFLQTEDLLDQTVLYNKYVEEL